MSQTRLDSAALPSLVTTEEAARFLHVHIHTVQALCRTGRLRATKAGRQWRIEAADLHTYGGSAMKPRERIRAELAAVDAQLREANDRLRSEAGQLEARVHERTGELQRANTALSAANTALSLRQSALEALLRSAQRLNAQLNLDAALRAVCEEARQTLGLPAAWINLYNPQREVLEFAVTDGMPPAFVERYRSPARVLLDQQVGQRGRLIVFPDVQVLTDIPNARLYADLDIRTIANATMVHQGQLIGVLSVVTFGESRELSEAELALLEALANQAALAITNSRLIDGLERELAERRRAERDLFASREQLRALSHRLVEVQEVERGNLSRELHDETGQVMTALKLGLSTLRRDPGCTPAMQAQIDELRRITDEAAESLHRLALNLRPYSLDRYGLAAALEGYLVALRDRAGLDVEFANDEPDAPRLPPPLETAFYRIAQEALTNIVRHARARRASVLLWRSPDGAGLVIEDDGSGFDIDAALRKGRLGLPGMRERAEVLGGSLTIESRPGQGTRICVTIPTVQDVQGG